MQLTAPRGVVVGESAAAPRAHSRTGAAADPGCWTDTSRITHVIAWPRDWLQASRSHHERRSHRCWTEAPLPGGAATLVRTGPVAQAKGHGAGRVIGSCGVSGRT